MWLEYLQLNKTIMNTYSTKPLIYILTGLFPYLFTYSMTWYISLTVGGKYL